MTEVSGQDLRMWQAAFDKGPASVDASPVETISSVMQTVSAAGSAAAAITADALRQTLQEAHDFIVAVDGLPAFILRIKNRPGK